MPALHRALRLMAPLLLLPFLLSAVPSNAAPQASSMLDRLRARVDWMAATRSPAPDPALEAPPPELAHRSHGVGALAPGSSASLRMERGATNLPGLIRMVDPRDRTTALDLVRGFLEDRYDDTSSSGIQEEEPLETEPGSEPLSSGTFAYPYSGGDLTGDGLEDVLVAEFDASDHGLAMQALRGSDAREIWRVELGADDGFGFSAGDIDGDGSDDLFFQSLEFLDSSESEECTDSGCVFDYSDRVRIVTGVRSGATGEKLWTKPLEGTLVFHWEDSYTSDATSASYESELRLEATNLFVLPILSGDHDGDGRPDVVLDAVDIEWESSYSADMTGVAAQDIWLVGNEEFRSSDRFATRASLLSGMDGRRLALLVAPKAPSLSFLEPAEDVSGDASPELLWHTWGIPEFSVSCERLVFDQCEVFEGNPHYSLETLDGFTLDRLWETRLDDVWDAYPLLFEFDSSGDGVNDIVIWSVGTSFEDFSIDVVDGRDGSTIWTRRGAEDQFPVASGDYGGHPGKDLIAVALRSSPGAIPFETEGSIVLVRIDGTGGETLFETEHPMPALEGSYNFFYVGLYAGGMADASGDGQDDAFSGSWWVGLTPNDETGEYEIAEARSAYRFESGADGSVLHSADGPTWFDGLPEPDLDGDGLADMSEYHYPLDEDADLRVVMYALSPPSALWERAIPQEEFWETTLWPSGDQDGVPGAEVLYGLNTEQDGHWSSVVASLKGANGAERWRQRR